jgi:hypothetical protein
MKCPEKEEVLIDTGWREGPLPKDTYNWGGVVIAGSEGPGFYFADFRGDHVIALGADNGKDRVLQPHEVKYYNNTITLPNFA